MKRGAARTRRLYLWPFAGGAGFAAASARRTTAPAARMRDVHIHLVLASRTFAGARSGLQAQPISSRLELKNFGHQSSSLPPYLLPRSILAKARSRSPESRIKPEASAC